MNFYAIADSALQSIWWDYHELDGASQLAQKLSGYSEVVERNWSAESVDELGVLSLYESPLALIEFLFSKESCTTPIHS